MVRMHISAHAHNVNRWLNTLHLERLAQLPDVIFLGNETTRLMYKMAELENCLKNLPVWSDRCTQHSYYLCITETKHGTGSTVVLYLQ